MTVTTTHPLSLILAAPLPHPSINQLAICLLILALLAWWVQESLDPGDRPREPFNFWRTHNTLAVLYQFLLTYRYGTAEGGTVHKSNCELST